MRACYHPLVKKKHPTPKLQIRCEFFILFSLNIARLIRREFFRFRKQNKIRREIFRTEKQK